MSNASDFDVRADACVYIPFDAQASTDSVEAESVDVVETACLSAYGKAWGRCLERIQSIVQALATPMLENALNEVWHAYSQPLPGLPYVELPMVVVSGGSSWTLELSNRIASGFCADASNLEIQRQAYVCQLHATGCGSVQSAMRTLVTGFISQPLSAEEPGKPRKRPAASLATYDIELLRAWYTEASAGCREEEAPLLVVAVNNLEQFDSAVLQDIYHICSMYIPSLPFVFLVSTSSPTPSTLVQALYPRITLSLLRIRYFAMPSGLHVLEEILAGVFFDPNWNPDVMIGSATLAFLVNYCQRTFASIDGIITILQIAHMKHFERPLCAFVHDELLLTDAFSATHSALQTPSTFELLDELLIRLHASSAARGSDWRNLDVAGFSQSVSSARRSFADKARGLRHAFRAAQTVQAWMAKQGYHGIDAAAAAKDLHPRLTMMKKTMNSVLGRDIKYLGMMIGKLDAERLHLLVQELRICLEDARLEDGEADLHHTLSRLHHDLGSADTEDNVAQAEHQASITTARQPRDPGVISMAEDLRTLFVSFTEARLVPLDSAVLPLWDIWFMGSSPFPSELIDPAPRSSLLAGLTYPHSYHQAILEASGGDNAKQSHMRFWDLPDASILFHRYLDAGRMINVHDWFESFRQMLDAQRVSRASATTTVENSGTEHDTTKRRHRHQAPQTGLVDTEDNAATSEDNEVWRAEVQARFMRALQELDFLGFIKHTKRKADHVLKTMFELPDQ